MSVKLSNCRTEIYPHSHDSQSSQNVRDTCSTLCNPALAALYHQSNISLASVWHRLMLGDIVWHRLMLGVMLRQISCALIWLIMCMQQPIELTCPDTLTGSRVSDLWLERRRISDSIGRNWWVSLCRGEHVIMLIFEQQKSVSAGRTVL